MLTVQQGLTAASSGGLTVDSQQPTSDGAASSSYAQTGLSVYKRVEWGWFLQITNTVGAPSTRNITLSARVSGGTKRTLASITTPSIGSNANMLFSGHAVIMGFNQSQEKFVALSYNFSADATTLDSSNAVNTSDNTRVSERHLLLTWDEVWDEVSIDLGSNVIIEGSAADQRGRWYVAGQA